MSRALPNFHTAFIALMLAIVACNAPATASPDQQSLPPAPTESAVEPAAAPSPTPAPGQPAATQPPAETPAQPGGDQQGGFNAPALDVATFPTINYLVTGMGPILCEPTPPASDVAIMRVIEMQWALCLYGFPNRVGGQPFSVTLTAPDGAAYSESFTVVGGEFGDLIVGQRTGARSSVFSETDEPPAYALIFLTFSLGLPQGEWQVAANTDDNSVSATGTISVGYSEPINEIFLPDAAPDPFLEPLITPGYSPGETVSIRGVGYTPSSDLVVALLDVSNADFSAYTVRATYGASVRSDASGAFSAAFTVGSETPKVTYSVSVAPNPQALQHNPFGPSFIVE